MKPKVDLEAAAQAESSGALAVGRPEFRRGRPVVVKGQAGKAFAVKLARHLLGLVRETSRGKSLVKSGRVSFRLTQQDGDHVLTIRGLR